MITSSTAVVYRIAGGNYSNERRPSTALAVRLGGRAGSENIRRWCSSNLVSIRAHRLWILNWTIGYSISAFDRAGIRTAKQFGIFDSVGQPLKYTRLFALSISASVDTDADMGRIEAIMLGRLDNRSSEGKGGSDEDEKRSSEETHFGGGFCREDV